MKDIASLYRRWPRRKFALTESIDLFEIPNHRGVYRVTAVYEYKFDNQDEHLSGKSKLTCVVEHDRQGTRIIGVDEKLVTGARNIRKSRERAPRSEDKQCHKPSFDQRKLMIQDWTVQAFGTRSFR